ncbi:MAG TPA: 2-C-methyl-D-erythritol 2,4-cyclodiphosphate synthase, partial [Bacillota bacterium]|nr:2-C-methyl-D-erythritol 2,4-cyclodiphosphate synthase [Bacillota bacterium]
GDIGTHFPPSDPKYGGADSLELLKKTALLLEQKGFRLINLDATIIAEAPKLVPYIGTMRQNIARALNTGIENISVKATTEEKLGFTGDGSGIAAHAISLIEIRH